MKTNTKEYLCTSYAQQILIRGKKRKLKEQPLNKVLEKPTFLKKKLKKIKIHFFLKFPRHREIFFTWALCVAIQIFTVLVHACM